MWRIRRDKGRRESTRREKWAREGRWWSKRQMMESSLGLRPKLCAEASVCALMLTQSRKNIQETWSVHIAERLSQDGRSELETRQLEEHSELVALLLTRQRMRPHLLLEVRLEDML
jgi:hypothetical protein